MAPKFSAASVYDVEVKYPYWKYDENLFIRHALHCYTSYDLLHETLLACIKCAIVSPKETSTVVEARMWDGPT